MKGADTMHKWRAAAPIAEEKKNEWKMNTKTEKKRYFMPIFKLKLKYPRVCEAFFFVFILHLVQRTNLSNVDLN